MLYDLSRLSVQDAIHLKEAELLLLSGAQLAYHRFRRFSVSTLQILVNLHKISVQSTGKRKLPRKEDYIRDLVLFVSAFSAYFEIAKPHCKKGQTARWVQRS